MQNLSFLEEKKSHGSPTLPVAVYLEPPDFEYLDIPLHWHKGFEVVVISHGPARFYINFIEYNVNTGDVVIVPTNALHSVEACSDTFTRCHTVIFDMSILESIAMDTVTLSYIAPINRNEIEFLPHITNEFEGHSDLVAINSLIIDLMTNKPLAYELQVKAKLFEMMVVLFSNPKLIQKSNKKEDSVDIELLRRVLTYTREHFTEEISIPSLSKIVGFSDDYFIRFFKKYMNQTPLNYIMNLRLDYARLLLNTTDRSITEISMDSGYNNLSYFVKSFKARYGMTPGNYKKDTNLGEFRKLK